jgi:predicted dehydrogenase
MYGKPAVESVSAELGTVAHADRTDLDDHAVATLRLAGGRLGLVEASWARPGGLDNRLEVIGDAGVTSADLVHGSALVTFSAEGYGYAVEKAPETRGWTFTMFEESWHYGFPQEMAHFVDCVLDDREPEESGEDGRAVLEAIYAMYRSAGEGRRVTLPLEVTPEERAAAPVALWKPG